MRVILAGRLQASRQHLQDLSRQMLQDCSFLHAGSLPEVRAQLDLCLLVPGGTLLIAHLATPGLQPSLRALREAYRATKLIVVMEAADRLAILACLEAGVHGCLLAADPAATQRHAIQTVIEGGIHVPPALSELDAPQAHLTARQHDVLALLLQGQSTKDIARTLKLGLGNGQSAPQRRLSTPGRTQSGGGGWRDIGGERKKELLFLKKKKQKDFYS